MPALTDDERALLRAVIADPDADLPRLVYADYLDDRGRDRDADRANLIRYQIAHPDRETGVNAVLLPELPGNALASVRRGFAVWVGLTLAEFWTHAADLFSRHPIVAVRLDDRFPIHIGESGDRDPCAWNCGLKAEAVLTGNANVEAHLIPAEVADLATSSRRPVAGQVAFSTSAAAADWLSARCVRFGRRAAGVG
jgi:uncharacterized protein (TIGR02996 family)